MDTMTPIQINGLYRHFKGNYYVVDKLAKKEADEEPMVVYTSVSTGATFIRPLEEFFSDVSDRPDNKTHQVTRFELAQEIKGLLSFTDTADLVEELKKRPDNPYEGFKTLEEDEDVWSVRYILGRVIEHSATENSEAFEEFVPITPQAFETLEAVKKYRSTFYPNRPCVIARRVTKKVECIN